MNQQATRKARRGDALLLLLYACNGGTFGMTRLQAGNLLLNEIKPSITEAINIAPYEFNKTEYGPFSSKVHEFITFFEKFGLICTEFFTRDDASVDAEAYLHGLCCSYDSDMLSDIAVDETRTPCYSLMDKGRRYIKPIWLRLSALQRKRLVELARGVNNFAIGPLLSYIFTKYPDRVIDSRIKDDIIKRFKYQW